MSRPLNTFNVPDFIPPSSSRSHPNSVNSLMHQLPYVRPRQDRGTPPPPTILLTDGSRTTADSSQPVHFDFASASNDRHLHSTFHVPLSFASANPDPDEAERRFERELADSAMDQYFAFDALDPSSPFLSNSSPTVPQAIVDGGSGSASHASPPPPSDVDGASPALSDSNSNFGFGSPSPASWSASTLALAEAGASPCSPPLSSPSHDFPALVPAPGPGQSGLGLGLGFAGDKDGEANHNSGGTLFANPYSYGYEYDLGNPDPYAFLSANLCGDASGLDLDLVYSPNAESAPAPWDTLDLMSPQSQPQPHQQTQSPKVDFESRSRTAPVPQDPALMQGQGQQLYFPSSEAMDVPPRPRLAPYTSSGVSPRDLELPASASAPVAPSTPTWATQLYAPPQTSSTPMILAEHGRSVSEASVFQTVHHGQTFDFVPPPSASAAIPIPSSANSNNEFFTYGHSLTQLFQPASAPAHAQTHSNSGTAFMPPSDSAAFRAGALGSPFNIDAHTEPPLRGSGSVTSGGLRARMRSYSHRMSSGLRDAQRAVFSTRASAGFAQGQQQVQQDKMRLKTDETQVSPSFDRDPDVKMNLGSDDNMATVRVAFPTFPSSPSSMSLRRGLDQSETNQDPDATVRRKKRTLSSQTAPHLRGQSQPRSRSREREPSSEIASSGKEKNAEPLRSELRPPKLAPSTWQLYFTDWIQKHQMMHGSDRKLNVAQAAKEAGAEYASLTAEQKEPYKRRSQAAKEAREREMAAWQRTLTPDDIKRENAYRAAQRRAGKSRKGNIKDPNAPKKPLSAYFMFLQHIRADPERVRRVFGDERETTAQSVLAAQTWRAMSDEERKPFLAQAEKEKLEYEAARRMYEEGTVGFETTISFSETSPTASGSGSSSIVFPSYSPSPSGSGMGTTFVIGRPAHEAGLGPGSPSDSEGDEMEGMESEGGTDEERGAPRFGGRL